MMNTVLGELLGNAVYDSKIEVIIFYTMNFERRRIRAEWGGDVGSLFFRHKIKCGSGAFVVCLFFVLTSKSRMFPDTISDLNSFKTTD